MNKLELLAQIERQYQLISFYEKFFFLLLLLLTIIWFSILLRKKKKKKPAFFDFVINGDIFKFARLVCFREFVNALEHEHRIS